MWLIHGIRVCERTEDGSHCHNIDLRKRTLTVTHKRRHWSENWHRNTLRPYHRGLTQASVKETLQSMSMSGTKCLAQILKRGFKPRSRAFCRYWRHTLSSLGASTLACAHTARSASEMMTLQWVSSPAITRKSHYLRVIVWKVSLEPRES